MATYIMLGQFTDQGIRNVKETTRRADAVKEMAKKVGATVRDVYWTMGRYDIAGDRRGAGRGLGDRVVPEHRGARERRGPSRCAPSPRRR